MATERQLAANRANAKRSTGPKTNAGRYASSRNAVRHGLACQPRQTVSIDVDDVADALIAQGAQEDQIVSARQAIRAHLELMRVRAVRAALLASFEAQCSMIDGLYQVLALDRYERLARGKRRRAAKRLCPE